MDIFKNFIYLNILMKFHLKRVIKLNHPYPSTRKDKKMMVFVENPRTNRLKTIHFGQVGYRHNYSKMSRMKYLARSGGIRDGNGRLTKNNPMSANYWARRVLWGRKR